MLANPLRRSLQNSVIKSLHRLKIGLKCFANRPGVHAVVLPVCGDELLNPVGITNIGLGPSVEGGTIVDVENGLKAYQQHIGKEA